jgi:hypothetical protein
MVWMARPRRKLSRMKMQKMKRSKVYVWVRCHVYDVCLWCISQGRRLQKCVSAMYMILFQFISFPFAPCSTVSRIPFPFIQTHVYMYPQPRNSAWLHLLHVHTRPSTCTHMRLTPTCTS